jgi:transposase
MFSLSNAHRYFLYNGDCDMRKSFNGLCGLVSAELGRDPTSGEVFIFVNRRRTHIKLLHWQPGGLVLYYKRLEAGTFAPPKTTPDGLISWPQLVLMVEGMVVESLRQKRRFHLNKTA